jgi:hypothetical protein
MKLMEIDELAVNGIAFAGMGAGIALQLAPKQLTALFGLDLGNGAGRDIFLRGLGMRDLVLGAGIILNRKQPQQRANWLSAFGLCLAADGLAAVLALRKPDANKRTVLIAVQSLVLAGVAFYESQRLRKSK